MDFKGQERQRPVPRVNYILIAIQFFVFVVGFAGGGRLGEALYLGGVLYAPLILKGQGFYRLISSVFLHADPAHLVNNMVVQLAGGGIVEKNLGHARFAALYILSGLAGNLASVLMDFLSRSYGFSIGASGAVFGIIGALVWMILQEALRARRECSPAPEGMPEGMEPRERDDAISRPAGGHAARAKNLLVRAGFMSAWLLYSGWANPTINQAAHVGGFLGGLLFAALFVPRRAGGIDLGELYGT